MALINTQTYHLSSGGFNWRLYWVWPLWITANFWGRCFELSSNCESRFTERNSVKIMNLKSLTGRLVLYGTARSPEAARVAHKESLSFKRTPPLSLCMLKCDLKVIIWLQGAADLLISLASKASSCCHRDDYLSELTHPALFPYWIQQLRIVTV